MGDWSNGLFGCFSNCGVCIITYFLPCITAGQTAEKVGESCCLYGFLSILGPIGIYTRAVIRGKVRESKGIDVSKMFFFGTLLSVVAFDRFLLTCIYQTSKMFGMTNLQAN